MFQNSSNNDLIPIQIDVLLKSNCFENIETIENSVKQTLESNCTTYVNGVFDISSYPNLSKYIQEVTVYDVPDNQSPISFWKIQMHISVYSLNDEGPCDEILDNTSDVTAYQQWILPSYEFHHLWDRLVYDTDIKSDLLHYAYTSLLFSSRHVDSQIISVNRLILLHGPPGTGKTSLCKALAQKLSICLNDVYDNIQFIEINAHSLFSKWFSESGKLVMKLFNYIQELLEDSKSLVIVLIDEVESLSASRQQSMNGSEPSDAIRVVNALLTQMDKLRRYSNILILTTSNITSAIDSAFLDRADFKKYIGPPGIEGRYNILRECIQELIRTHVINSSIQFPCFSKTRISSIPNTNSFTPETSINQNLKSGIDDETQLLNHLYHISLLAEGLSGRTLRKLPFQAYACYLYATKNISINMFLNALESIVHDETKDRECLETKNKN